MVTPSGPRMAGQYGVSLLSLSMSVAEGFAAIGQAWGVAEEQAAKHGNSLDRRDWRVLGTMHLAETKEQAIEDCTHGLKDFANYFGGGAGFVPLANTVTESSSERDYVEAYAASGNVVIGTPDDAIAYIEDLIEQSGGFGTFLLLGHDWADPEATYRSYRLFAREVVPHFQNQLAAPRASHDWATAKRHELFGRAGQAMLNAITDHVEEKEAGRLMRAAALRDGEIVVRDDVADPRPGPGQALVRVKACGICGSDLHFATHGAEMLALSRSMEGLPDLGTPPVDLDADVFMGHEFSAEVVELGPDTVGARRGDAGDLDPDPGGRAPASARSSTPTTSRPGTGSRCCSRRRCWSRSPTASTPRHAALTEPMAVGLHAVNKSSDRRGRGGAGARLRPGRPRGDRRARAEGHRPHRGRRLLGRPAVDGRVSSVPTRWSTPGTRPRSRPGVGPAALREPGRLRGHRRARDPRRGPAGGPDDTRVVVVGVCMQPDTIHPFFGIGKELNLQFVLGYDPMEFSDTLRHIAEGEIDVTPMITGEVDLDGVAGAFAALADPDEHCKILVHPLRADRR